MTKNPRKKRGSNQTMNMKAHDSAVLCDMQSELHKNMYEPSIRLTRIMYILHYPHPVMILRRTNLENQIFS